MIGPRKVSIRVTVWGNWYGYVSGRRVMAFGNSTTETAEQAARRWLSDRQRTERDTFAQACRDVAADKGEGR